MIGGLQFKTSGLVLDMAHQSPLGTIPLVGSDYKDFSMYGNHGTPTNVTSSTLSSGLAVPIFDGTAYVTLTTPHTLTTGETILMWIRPDVMTAYESLFGTGLAYGYVRLRDGYETTRMDGETDTNTDTFYLSHLAIPFVAETWYLVAIRIPSATTIDLHVNGQYMDIYTITDPHLTVTYIGKGYSSNPWDGGIAFLRIYKRLPDATELGGIYTAEKWWFGL